MEIGRGCAVEGVEAQRFAQVDGHRRQPVVDGNTRAIGNPNQARERSDRCRSLTCPVGPDQRNHSGAEVVERLAPNRRLGEGKQFLRCRDVVTNDGAADRCQQFRIATERFAARTEQRGVGRRSIEAFVHRGDARGDELDLRT